MNDKFYITTAIAYASRQPHIGNDYEIIFTDSIARYHRLLGEDVFMLTGTDEHGQKIQDLAAENHIQPKEYADSISNGIIDNYKTLNISNDKFIRTTDSYHEKVVQKVFTKLYEQGEIYKSEYEGWYCTPCESFWTETQLVDGCCPDCGRPVKKTKEEAYFFRMSKYQGRLMDYIEKHPDFIQPESRKKEMINNFLKPGLQDLCVSRTTFTWGVPVPFDTKHVIYVWIDALLNYITAIGYDPDGSSDQFKRYWPCDVHIIGKDILRFHTIYWPIMLIALDIPLPKKVFGHPWLLFGNDKMSKSKGNVMYSKKLSEYFGVDGVRYYVLSEMPYAQDGSITYEAMAAKYNSDLANTVGNLVNRTVAMVHKYFGGVVPAPVCPESLDEELKQACFDAVNGLKRNMDEFRTADAIDAIMNLARRSNKYIDETMPWVLAKEEEKNTRLGTVLYNLLEAIRYIAVTISPFLPETSDKILQEINTSASSLSTLDSFGAIIPGSSVGEAIPLFSRIDEAKLLKQVEEDQKAAQPKEKEEPKKKSLPENVVIGIEDFSKVSLKVALVKQCEKVEKSDKLLKLILDDGQGERQVVSGIAAWYMPDDLIGKKVVVVANLKPAKLRGVESNGMILAADCPNGEVKVIFVDEAIPQGSKIR